MSRCFPYPPPGYARNGVSGQALIESIKSEIVSGQLKLQRRKEKDKTEQAKEKKRERKERKKERKEKEKLKSLEISANVKKIVGDVIGNCLPKQREEEAEQVKSDLTEEHEQPISSQNLLYLSDSTQNSNKRKRHASPSTESHNNAGKVIRIRFSFKKQKGADASSNEEGVCSTSGRTAYPPAQEIPRAQQQQCRDTNTRTNITSVGLASEPNKILPSCSKMNSVSPLVSAGNISGSSRNKARSVEMLYKSLVEDWLPPPLSIDENDTGELEWLLGTEQRKGSRVKRNETEEGALCHVSSTLWPRANFLPNADIHALPYTIPF